MDDRSHALLEAYVKLPSADNLAQYMDRSKINATFVRVTRWPKDKDAEDLADAYDLARAIAILDTQNVNGDGPFIVSASVRLSAITWRVHHLSIIDLSAAPAGSMQLWLTHFTKVSRHPEEWMANGANAVALRVHDSLSAVGSGGNSAVEALEDGTKVLKAIGGG